MQSTPTCLWLTQQGWLLIWHVQNCTITLYFEAVMDAAVTIMKPAKQVWAADCIHNLGPCCFKKQIKLFPEDLNILSGKVQCWGGGSLQQYLIVLKMSIGFSCCSPVAYCDNVQWLYFQKKFEVMWHLNLKTLLLFKDDFHLILHEHICITRRKIKIIL